MFSICFVSLQLHAPRGQEVTLDKTSSHFGTCDHNCGFSIRHGSVWAYDEAYTNVIATSLSVGLRLVVRFFLGRTRL